MALLNASPPITIWANEDRRRHPAICREAPVSAQSSRFSLEQRLLKELEAVGDVSCYQQQEQDFSERLAELRGLQQLSRGWDTYSAEPPNAPSIKLCKMALMLLRRQLATPIAVRASAEGGVAVSFASGTRRAQLEFLNNGEAYAITYGVDDPADSWEIEPTEAGIGEAWKRVRAFVQS